MSTITHVRTAPEPTPLVTLDEASHVYTHQDGHRPPSVTTILGAVPPWAGRFDRVPPERLAFKQQVGIMVHRATHYFDDGALDVDSVDPAIAGYLEAWKLFRLHKRFRPSCAETAVYHPLHGYAGTLDRIGVVDTRAGRGRVLIDIKTGDGTMAGPQTAAYLEAWRALAAAGLCGIDPNEALIPTDRWTVQLRDDGTYVLTPHASRNDWHVFLAALTIWRYRRDRSHSS